MTQSIYNFTGQHTDDGWC